ncbi:N-acetylneuraminate synthase family protein [Nitrosomonas sp.]|uniref:N-acetylneuraminate synthase family protein n=1 Tax=Nitrosomonas sp. TaxID=42353 RepID=UPI001DD4B110|nr:N-acetylneuraminate synthase family protein [Nitrosomonas sp.]MCB1947597.1 N-acetylneuraminate synthase family protein [Nitrosomonas sp.]MCP5242269.1 N-acetylneuraminate synthase family protein [Burkholderiales bacterium]MDR4514149.1 N-acetylneuraminate synthase family protein [Nitrosomonas sp.]
MKTPKVVAEIGCNHKGSIDIAKEMIGVAATFAKCDYVKFQKRSNKELLTPEEYNAPHPNPQNSYGETYGAHREFLEFDIDQHRQLKEYCESLKIGYSTSVWDLTSAKQIASLEPGFIKIPSACNLNFAMLEYLACDYEGDIHVSLGMTTPAEVEQIVAFIEKFNSAKRVVLYACTSGYPVPFNQVCLLELQKLHTQYDTRVKEIGFSGHHLGIAVDSAAVALGASWIERHFTLDRTWKGTDHAASLEPDGLRRLTRDVRAVSAALTFKESDILEIEAPQRKKLKRISGIHFD